MFTFTSYDGTEVTCLGSEEAPNPLVCLPGGPLLDPHYLGDLGGLDAYRDLVMMELPARRLDRIVADVEALRRHLGRERLDILAHSAAGNLALRYAAQHPERVGRLALVTAGTLAVGIDQSDDELRARLARRSDEPWYSDAIDAVEAVLAGDASPATRLRCQPLFHGRWDEQASAQAAREQELATPGAAGIYYAEGALDPEATKAGLTHVSGDVLLLAGDLDPYPPPDLVREVAALFPRADVVVQPGAGHVPWLDDAAAFTSTVGKFLTV